MLTWLRNYPRTTLLVISAVLLLGYLCCSQLFLFYSIKSYRGDGTIIDTGFFSYPQYHITFPAISLDSVDKHHYRLSNLPPTRMTLSFRVTHLGQNLTDEKVIVDLKKSPVVLRFKLTDDAGVVIGETRLPIREWVFNISARELSLWEYGSRELEIDPNRTYNLDVEIDKPLPEAADYCLEPCLEGGGHELP